MFDHIAFLEDKFVNAGGIVSLLQSYDVACPPKDTVRKWFERGGIPTQWMPVLLCVLEIEEGEPVRLAKYLRNENGCAA